MSLVKHRLLVSLFCFLLAAPGLFAQGMSMTMTQEDQTNLLAPSSSGETGLFTTVTADTLKKGDLSFGIYFQDYDLLAAPARQFAPLSARRYHDMGYDLYRTNVSVGFGLLDRWEVSGSLPWDRLQNHGGDRAGFINGYLYQGRFTESGVGDLHLATKFGLLPPGGPTRFALSLFTDLPTGDKNSGIGTGNGSFGVGAHWTRGIASLAGTYEVVGNRSRTHTNYVTSRSVSLPNELRLDGGLNIPLGFWRTTNWINEVNGT